MPHKLISLKPITEHGKLHPGRQLLVLLGNVKLDFDWLPATFPENCIKINHFSTMN